jgi:hypothetical protein
MGEIKLKIKIKTEPKKPIKLFHEIEIPVFCEQNIDLLYGKKRNIDNIINVLNKEIDKNKYLNLLLEEIKQKKQDCEEMYEGKR